MDQSECELRDHAMNSTNAGEGTSTGPSNTSVPAELTSGTHHLRETARGVMALEIGRSPTYNTRVWASMVRCRDGHPLTRYYDNNMKWCTGKDLNIIWNDAYKPSNFEGRFKERMKNQREYIFNILTQVIRSKSSVKAATSGDRQGSPELPLSAMRGIRYNEIRGRGIRKGKRHHYHVLSDDDSGVESQPRPSRKIKRESPTLMPSNGFEDDLEMISSNPAPRNSPRTNSEAHDSNTHARTKSQLLSDKFTPHELARTRFLVNSSLQLDQAPIHVPLKDCSTMQELFASVTGACKISNEDATEISEISVIFVWSGEQQLVRKHRPYEWNNFIDILRKAWDTEAAWFEKEGCCKVRMVVLIPQSCKKERAGAEVKCE